MKTTKRDKYGTRGVAHGLIAVPKGYEDKVIITGMTTNSNGYGAAQIANITKTLTSEYQERLERHIEEARSQLGSLKNIVFLEGYRGNAFVRQGLNAQLNSMFGDLTSDEITHIGLSADTAAVTIATTNLDPGTAGNSIKVTANTSINTSTSIVSTDQTWTQADVSWAITKIGLLRGALVTDVSNIIGGTGGSAPYDEPFTIDLQSVPSWTLTMGIDTQAIAS